MAKLEVTNLKFPQCLKYSFAQPFVKEQHHYKTILADYLGMVA